MQTVKPALQEFYDSLNDEQKARFNEIGPQLGKHEAASAPKDTAGRGQLQQREGRISNLAINRIEETVRPTETRARRWTSSTTRRRRRSTRCARLPQHHPQTPVGRLDVMQKRLEAMIEAANKVRPALESSTLR